MFEDIIKEGQQTREEGLERERMNKKPTISGEFRSKIDILDEKEKQVLLAMTMQSLRGSWGNHNDRLSIVFYLCDSIKTLPIDYIKAVVHNAFMFDGILNDGRIFRDGDRKFGLSGNLAYAITGDDRIKKDGFYGTYDELWAILGVDDSHGVANGRSSDMIRCMTTVYKSILKYTSDLSWEELDN
jgi:hypothetical protein